jgi:hypothetical protein
MEKQLNESTLHRLTAGQNGSSAREEAAKGRLISQVQAYRNLTDVPQTRDLQVSLTASGGGGRWECTPHTPLMLTDVVRQTRSKIWPAVGGRQCHDVGLFLLAHIRCWSRCNPGAGASSWHQPKVDVCV